MKDLQYAIGQKFVYHKNDYEIIDVFTITNAAGEIIRRYYITENFICGQRVCGEMPEATITRALLKKMG